jgi:hypothetical protein
MFILAIRLFDMPFIENNFSSSKTLVENKDNVINVISGNLELLNQFIQCKVLFKQIINASNLLRIILENTDVEWKMQNINSFIFVPISLPITESFVNSHEWTNTQNTNIGKICIQKTIISLQEYIKDPSIYSNQNEITNIFSFILSKYSSFILDIQAGNSVYKETNYTNISLGLKILDIFKENNVLYDERLVELLEQVNNHIQNKSIGEPTSNEILNMIKDLKNASLIEKQLSDIASSAINVSNNDDVILLGITCLQKLGEHENNIVEDFRSILELIYSSGRLNVIIDELIGKKETLNDIVEAS